MPPAADPGSAERGGPQQGVGGADRTEEPAATAPPRAVVDLLGALAYGELTAFLRLAEDAELAPTVTATAAVARLAATEHDHFELLAARLVELGADPGEAMEPFAAAVDVFHARTRPGDWLEGLVKAYVGEGIATDVYREVAAYVDPATRDLVHGVLSQAAHVDVVVPYVREAIEADSRVAGRLALWGRRLVGEAMSQAQRVAAEHEGLTSLLVGGEPGSGADLLEASRIFTRVTDAHVERMRTLGLTA